MKQISGALILLWVLLPACIKTDPVGSIPPDTSVPSTLTEVIIKDTAYGPDKKQALDIYLPAGRTLATKTIVLIHGGSWVGGDKNDMNVFVTLFRKKWPEAAILNVNYRYANGNNIILKDLLDDLESAIGLLVNNGASFQVSDNIALFGASAGAHLAMMYGYTKRSAGELKCIASLYGPAKINDWDWYSNSGLIPIAEWLQKMTGGSYDDGLYRSASPLEALAANVPPTTIFHGTLDFVVPIRQSRQLKSRLDALNIPAEYKEYIAFHGFNDGDNNDCVTRSTIFFKKHMP